MSPRPAVGRRYLATSPFNTPPVEPVIFTIGDWVDSDRHGLGRVVRTEGGDDTPVSIVVDYRDGHLRRFTLPNAKLTNLGQDGGSD